jgi:lipopolysaccharide/colanic/teichoic acid biosynthesis glycosyltransferase
VFYNEFETYIHGFHQRLMVKPGLTGLAQINGGYDLPPEKKIVLDIEYMKNRSFWFDIKLILKTVAVVFSHEGAR